MRVVTGHNSYLCRKVIIACGLLHFPRHLDVLDRLGSMNVHYRIPRIGDYEGKHVAIVGGGDSALDAALIVLGRSGRVQLIVREATPEGKADTLARVKDNGGVIHTSTEIQSAELAGDQIRLTLTDGERLGLRARHRADRLSVGAGHVRTPGGPAQRRRQHRGRPVLRDQPPGHFRRRGRPRRYQTDHRGMGRRHPSRNSRVQGDHEPILAQRQAPSGQQDRAHGR